MTMQPIYVRVPTELREWIKKRAMEERRSISDFVRIVLEDYRIAEEKQTQNGTPTKSTINL